MSLVEKLTCPDCLLQVEKLKENGLCPICSKRKSIMKEKYVAFKTLPEKDKERIIKQRESSKKLYDARSHIDKVINTKPKESKNEKLHKELEKEINENLEMAYSKLNLGETENLDKISDLKMILEIINILVYYDEKKLTEQKQILNRKIDTIDKYMIDIQHNIEHLKFNDDEALLLEAKKQNIIRDIRRNLKNKENTLELAKKFFKTINRDISRLNDIKDNITGFIKAIETEKYNPYVENPKSDHKILGLHKFRCSCQVTSPTTNRKVLKESGVVDGKDSDNAKEEFIKILRKKHGEGVVWTTIQTTFLK